MCFMPGRWCTYLLMSLMWLEQNFSLVSLFCLVFLTQITVTKNTKLLICYSISSDIESVIHHCSMSSNTQGWNNIVRLGSCQEDTWIHSVLVESLGFFSKLMNSVFFPGRMFVFSPLLALQMWCFCQISNNEKTPFAENDCVTQSW